MLWTMGSAGPSVCRPCSFPFQFIDVVALTDNSHHFSSIISVPSVKK